MANLPQVDKSCDIKTRDLVFGFVKDIQKSVQQIIPVHIINICLAFYLIIERFIECGNKYIKISEDGKKATNEDEQDQAPWDTAYGEFEINCDDEYNKNIIFEWIIYVHNDALSCCSIGIDETKRLWVNQSGEDQNGTVHYNLRTDGNFYSCQGGQFQVKHHGYFYGAGHTIIMHFDVGDKTLTFYKSESSELDDKKEIFKMDEIKTDGVKFCLACYIWRRGCFELKGFNLLKKKSKSNTELFCQNLQKFLNIV